ncbi:MAG: DsrE family protein [Nitrososphaerota archaeon]|nr:DsrE family protein [Nitrososphaerota archaeon]MDG6922243.1 DsrE family protein [Nitrososphaerota archaeon]
MTEFGIILTQGAYQTQRWETAYNIANAVLNASDKVTFFLFMDGIYNALSTERFPAMQKLPKDYFRSLLDAGAKIYACEVCTYNRGLEEGKDYLKGVEIIGAVFASEMVSKCERIITL